MNEIPYIWEVEPRLILHKTKQHKITASLNLVDLFIDCTSDSNSESMIVFNQDQNGNIINIYKLNYDELIKAPVTVREIFKAALLSDAASITIAHNSNGDPAPSEKDIEITRLIIRCGQLMGIPLIDHIIIDSEIRKMYSFVISNYDMFNKTATDVKKEFPHGQ